ncbi:MAG TPA: endonuclease VII domain-containing protein [Verrucomicrobiae bacterium]|nr:endonuclease VII domain-containing protein [Verrucomicrobiae bacterium]
MKRLELAGKRFGYPPRTEAQTCYNSKDVGDFRYGITPAEFAAIWEAQDGLCAICAEHMRPASRWLFVDYCHTTKRVRGLLCQPCKIALGMLRESPYITRQMLDYIQFYHGDFDPCAPEPDREEF